MAERSFAKEVKDLRIGAGEVFHGEGILAVTKALLQSGVSYVGGYQGARLTHFAMTIGLILFVAVHVLQVVRSGWGNAGLA